MKKLALACALTTCLSGAMFAEELTGYVSDSHCGPKHKTVSDANTKCVNGCLKGGASPVLVSGDKVYKIDADSADKVKSFAGQDVKVDGSVDGDTVKVSSIEAAK